MILAQRKILKIFSKPRKKLLFKAKFEQLFTVTKKQIIKQINNHIYSSFNYLYKETSFSSNNLETY